MGNETSIQQNQPRVVKTVVKTKTVYKDRPQPPIQTVYQPPQRTVPHPKRVQVKPTGSQVIPTTAPYNPPTGSQVPIHSLDTNILQRETRTDTRLPVAQMTSIRDEPPAMAPQSYVPYVNPSQSKHNQPKHNQPKRNQPMRNEKTRKPTNKVTVTKLPSSPPQVPAEVQSQQPKQPNISKFSDAMKQFIREYDPYKLLKVDRTADMATIKKSYKKMALKYHPDKGGNQEVFDKITKAYKYLKSISTVATVETPTQDHTSLRRQAQNVDQPSAAVMKSYADNFSLNKFNEHFDRHKIGDESIDKGYGEFMTTDSREADSEPATAERIRVAEEFKLPERTGTYDDRTNFNLNVFNEEFKDELAITKMSTLNPELPKHEQSVQVYKEPIAFTSGSQGYSDIDRQAVSDFTSFHDPLSSSNSQQYTDYMSAFTTRSTFTNSATDDTSREDFRNLDDLKRARANISYEMSEEDKEKIAEQERRIVEAENERLRRIAERDHMFEEHNTYISRQFLDN